MDHVLSQEQQSGHRFQSVNVDVSKITLTKNHTEKLKNLISQRMVHLFLLRMIVSTRCFFLLSSATVNVHLDV